MQGGPAGKFSVSRRCHVNEPSGNWKCIGGRRSRRSPECIGRMEIVDRDLTENVPHDFKAVRAEGCLKHSSLRLRKRIRPPARHPEHGGEIASKNVPDLRRYCR